MVKVNQLALVKIFITIGIFIGLYYIWAQDDKTSILKNDNVPTVPVVKVIRSNLKEDITLSAELVPYQKATLYAKVSGYLKTINVDIGDEVKEGQILALLEVPELQDELGNQKAKRDITKLEYDRLNTAAAHHPGLIAQEDIDKAKADFEMAQAKYEHAQTMLNFATITAPYNSIVTKRFVDEGALIQVGTASSTQAQPIVEVAENSKLRLVFPVPEANVTTVKVGNHAQVTIKSTGQRFDGIIARMADQVDFDTRTMRTEIDVDNSTLKMKPGMYASVKLNLLHSNNALALPTQSVDMSGLPNVWIVTPQGRVKKQKVTLGIQTPNLIEITKGVAEGDMVVFGNRDLIRQGMTVHPQLIADSQFKAG